MKKGLMVILVMLAIMIVQGIPAADFDGDGTDDIAVFRPYESLWAIRNGPRHYFGDESDIPVPADYDGNGTDEIAIFRETTGLWAVRNGPRHYFGGEGDIPLSAVGGSHFRMNGYGNIISPEDTAVYMNGPMWCTADAYFMDDISVYNNRRMRFLKSDYSMGAEIFLYTNNNLVIDNETSGQFIKLRTENNDSQVLVLDGDGHVGIGTDDPDYKLEVFDSRADWAVAYIRNDSNNANADGLYITLDACHPGSNNKFVQFWDCYGAVGAIEGTGTGGVSYESEAADLAEWMPRMWEEEKIEPGDVVGIISGMVSCETGLADQISVVSTAPAFLGNAPGEENESRYEKVALLGKVPIKVKGAVKAGDFIVPSGENDGVGIAVSPDELAAGDVSRIAGRAWESSDEIGVKRVECAVGLRAGNQALSFLLKMKENDFQKLSQRVAYLESLVLTENENSK